MNTVNLLYCGNDDAYDEILLSLLSVMRHTKRRLGVYLMTVCIDRFDGAPIAEAKARYLSAILESRQDGSFLVFKDVSGLFMKEFGFFLEEKSEDSPYPLIRLLIDLTDLPQRILYLDSDTVASGDIGEIFDHDLKGRAFGGVRDRFGRWTISPGCLNEGVLLFDMDCGERQRLFQKARKRIKEKNGLLFLGWAFAFSDFEKGYLPRRFNEQQGIRKDTVLRHYCTTLSLLPYPHLKKHRSFERQAMSKRERTHFAKEIDQFYFCRDAYLEYEKNEG